MLFSYRNSCITPLVVIVIHFITISTPNNVRPYPVSVFVIKYLNILQILRIRTCSLLQFRITFCSYDLSGHSAAMLGQSQGLYLHRAAKHRKTRTNINASSGNGKNYHSVRTVRESVRLTIRSHCHRAVPESITSEHLYVSIPRHNLRALHRVLIALL
jgi:hypothetical protein